MTGAVEDQVGRLALAVTALDRRRSGGRAPRCFAPPLGRRRCSRSTARSAPRPPGCWASRPARAAAAADKRAHRVACNSASPLLATMTGSTTRLRTPQASKRSARSLDDRRGGEHAGFHRVGADVLDHAVDLERDDIFRHLGDREDRSRVLGGDRGEHRGAVDAERGEGFEIGLDAGAGAGIGTRR